MNILQCFIILVGCIQFYSASNLQKKPHIVFMIVDDLGWNDVSFHGSKQIPTPNIDAFARDGIILNQYYVQSICTPSRGSLMTGKYPIRIGFQQFVIRVNEPWGLPLEEKILPQYLKELNYATHAVGKWHLGFFKEDYLPLKRGFDSFFGYYSGVEDYFDHFSVAGNYSGLDLHDGYENAWDFNGTYGTDLFTAKAKKVIQEHNPAEPLFLYFAQQAPHSGNFMVQPLQAPEKYVKPMVGIKDKKRKIFAGMLSAMDYSVGEIIAALEKSGMLNDTIFIFTTDNGGAPQEIDGASGSNWPLKGSKYNLWEGGVRGVAFVWSPLLRLRSRIYNELMHITDWLPTILSAAGGPDALEMLPKTIDGVDHWSSLTDVMPSPRAEILLNIDDVAGMEGIRRGRYKLLKGSRYDGMFDKWYDPEGRIFDLINSTQTRAQKKRYEENYIRFLSRSKAAHILRKKYGKNLRLTDKCTTRDCKEQLEVQCGGPPPMADSCDAQKEPCLYDIISDPCEFYNIAQQLPEVVVELNEAIQKYKPFVVPSCVKPADPKADPRLHGGAWVPWR